MKILLTGITGFIGRNVLKELISKKNDITAIVRESTNPARYKEFAEKIAIEKIDLANIEKLRNYLYRNSFDVIIHIGALRNGRKFNKTVYHHVNIDSTEQFLINAKRNNSKFIYCSSVGVFGSIPNELPANNFTVKNPDNTYHHTKVQSEKLIQHYVLQGTKAYIIRPSITYGTNDYGFPYILTKLIFKRMLPLTYEPIKIHLTNVNLLAEAFKKIAETDLPNGSSFIVADRYPVDFKELTDFIHNKFYGKPYPISRYMNPKIFRLGEKIASFFKNETWEMRFKLISRNWYYDVDKTYEILNLKKTQTIPNFDIMINWFKKENNV